MKVPKDAYEHKTVVTHTAVFKNGMYQDGQTQLEKAWPCDLLTIWLTKN